MSMDGIEVDPKVNIIGIGAHRTGTTWLFECLDRHPEIETAKRANNKELNFFDHHYAKGFGWYHKLFEKSTVNTAEFSVRYLYGRAVPERLYNYNSNARLILSLRDPVERAISHHKHQIRRGRLPENLYRFEDALNYNPTYLEYGLYARYLKEFLKFFTLDQMFITFTTFIQSDPESLIRNLYGFLGVDTSFKPSFLDQKINTSHTYRSRALNKMMWFASDIIRTVTGQWSVDLIKSTKIPHLIRKLNSKKIEGNLFEPPNQSTINNIRRYFLDDIEELEYLLDRNISDWKSTHDFPTKP